MYTIYHLYYWEQAERQLQAAQETGQYVYTMYIPYILLGAGREVARRPVSIYFIPYVFFSRISKKMTWDTLLYICLHLF